MRPCPAWGRVKEKTLVSNVCSFLPLSWSSFHSAKLLLFKKSLIMFSKNYVVQELLLRYIIVDINGVRALCQMLDKL